MACHDSSHGIPEDLRRHKGWFTALETLLTLMAFAHLPVATVAAVFHPGPSLLAGGASGLVPGIGPGGR